MVELPNSQQDSLSDLQFAKQVLAYVPDACGEGLTHRVTLLKCRDWAAVHLVRTVTDLGYDLARHTHDIAGRMVYLHPESEARLAIASSLCRHLVGAALAADSLDSVETPL